MVKGTLLHPELKICRYPTCSPVPQAASWQQMMHNACVCVYALVYFVHNDEKPCSCPEIRAHVLRCSQFHTAKGLKL